MRKLTLKRLIKANICVYCCTIWDEKSVFFVNSRGFSICLRGIWFLPEAFIMLSKKFFIKLRF